MPMALPVTTAVRDPSQCLEDFVRAARRLVTEADVTLDFAELPPEDLGNWNSVTRVLMIRDAATRLDQLWMMQDLWWLLTIGPWATAGAIREPLLTLARLPREIET